jgi:hypothetical protein
MAEYLSPAGEIKQEAVDALRAAVAAQVEPTLAAAAAAWGPDVFVDAGLGSTALTL